MEFVSLGDFVVNVGFWTCTTFVWAWVSWNHHYKVPVPVFHVLGDTSEYEDLVISALNRA